MIRVSHFIAFYYLIDRQCFVYIYRGNWNSCLDKDCVATLMGQLPLPGFWDWWRRMADGWLDVGDSVLLMRGCRPRHLCYVVVPFASRPHKSGFQVSWRSFPVVSCVIQHLGVLIAAGNLTAYNNHQDNTGYSFWISVSKIDRASLFEEWRPYGARWHKITSYLRDGEFLVPDRGGLLWHNYFLMLDGAIIWANLTLSGSCGFILWSCCGSRYWWLMLAMCDNSGCTISRHASIILVWEKCDGVWLQGFTLIIFRGNKSSQK